MSTTNVGWSRSAQDAAEARDAAETPLPKAPRPQGLDRPVGYVTMRWVAVLASWFGLRFLGVLIGVPSGVRELVALVVVVLVASQRARTAVLSPLRDWRIIERL